MHFVLSWVKSETSATSPGDVRVAKNCVRCNMSPPLILDFEDMLNNGGKLYCSHPEIFHAGAYNNTLALTDKLKSLASHINTCSSTCRTKHYYEHSPETNIVSNSKF